MGKEVPHQTSQLVQTKYRHQLRHTSFCVLCLFTFCNNRALCLIGRTILIWVYPSFFSIIKIDILQALIEFYGIHHILFKFLGEPFFHRCKFIQSLIDQIFSQSFLWNFDKSFMVDSFAKLLILAFKLLSYQFINLAHRIFVFFLLYLKWVFRQI